LRHTTLSTLLPYTTLFRSSKWSLTFLKITPNEYGVMLLPRYDTFNAELSHTIPNGVEIKFYQMISTPLVFRNILYIALYLIYKEDRKSTRLNSSHVSISYA